MTDIWTVSLELPDCEAEDPVDAVREFQHQAHQEDLFVYRVRNDNTGESYHVDMAEQSVTKVDEP